VKSLKNMKNKGKIWKKNSKENLPAVAPGTCRLILSTRRGPEEQIECVHQCQKRPGQCQKRPTTGVHYAAVHILNSQSPSIFTIQSP
jgi:hypothetical protein